MLVLTDLSPLVSILVIALLALVAHFIVLGIRRAVESMITPTGESSGFLQRSKPKLKTISTIIVSAITFGIYFAAIGLILLEIGVSLTAYFASASVIGLAVAFGLQGLVQDVVIGFTLIFSDIIDIGDVVDMSGQTGRIEKIGLRFTILVNLHDQRVSVPNRTIGLISRYRRGYIRAYVDVQLPGELTEDDLAAIVTPIGQGMHRQYPSIILSNPELMGLRKAEPGGWRYLRYKFRLWPGQGSLLETTLKKRLQAAIAARDPEYQDWMITVTYRAQ